MKTAEVLGLTIPPSILAAPRSWIKAGKSTSGMPSFEAASVKAG